MAYMPHIKLTSINKRIHIIRINLLFNTPHELLALLTLKYKNPRSIYLNIQEKCNSWWPYQPYGYATCQGWGAFSPTGSVTVIRWSFSVFGNSWIIPILIVPNSTRLKVRQDSTAFSFSVACQVSKALLLGCPRPRISRKSEKTVVRGLGWIKNKKN